MSCSHCGLDVPRGRIRNHEELQFCCSGCETVYQVIHSHGLDRFYRIQAAAESRPVPARTTDRRYAEMDDPAFLEAHSVTVAPGVRTVELYLEGVHCSACVWLVEKLPRVLSGILDARLDLRRSLLRVTWHEGTTSLSRAARTLDSLGYPPHPARDSRTREARRREDRRFLVRLGVAGAGAGNVMILAFALYGGTFHGIEAQYGTLFRWTSMAIGLVTLFWPGNIFFRGALAALRTRTAHLDIPIALGLGAGAVAGTVNTILGRGEIYFDSLTALVFLLLVGRWIQHRQQRWASSSLELLYSLTPSFARVVDESGSREVPVEALEKGCIIEVLPGESLPADGAIAEGESTLDASLLTGEARPVPVAAGGRACAGMVNLSRPLRIRVEATGRDTRVGKLLALVEELSRRKAPIVLFADRIAGWFSAGVIALAAATLVAWLRIDPARAVDNAVSLLIVTCPCALGLATPLAVAVAIGRAARGGILIKGGDILEKLARPGKMFLDKTGTLTEARVRLVEWCGDASARPLVEALEARCSHPIALAFEPGGAGPVLTAEKVTQKLGAGIEGVVGGSRVAAGSEAFIREVAEEIPGWAMEARDRLAARAVTPVWIAVDRRITAIAGVGSPLRPGAADAVSELRRRGWSIAVLSGDDPAVVAAVAKSIAIPAEDARGAVPPEEKAATVERARQEGPVVMVGDGVNDAAALSAATVGIAVHGGAEASMAAADVYLSRPGLVPILDLTVASQRTLRAIHRSLGTSLVYNAAAATLAATGLISPLLAALLMPASSFTVIALAFGARTFGGTSCR